MGTDIHLVVERKQANGTWKIQIPPEPPPVEERTRKDDGWVDPRWGLHKCMCASKCYGTDGDDTCKGTRCRACLGTGRDLRWYRNRNYNVFAILTGTVRNGHGFAGVKTSSGFKGITKVPRGVPKDTDKPSKYHIGDHSQSWLTLDRILAFDWSQVTTHTGVVPVRKQDDTWGDRACYVDWRAACRKARRKTAPSSYSGGVSGGAVETITAREADSRLRRDDFRADVHYFVRVEWTETYRESAKDFLAFVDTFLKPLGEPYKHTRIVFGFDS